MSERKMHDRGAWRRWGLLLVLLLAVGCDLARYREVKKRKEAYREYAALMEQCVAGLRETNAMNPSTEDLEEAHRNKAKLNDLGRKGEELKRLLKRLGEWEPLDEQEEALQKQVTICFIRYNAALGYRFLGMAALESMKPKEKEFAFGGPAPATYGELLALAEAGVRQLDRRIEEW